MFSDICSTERQFSVKWIKRFYSLVYIETDGMALLSTLVYFETDGMSFLSILVYIETDEISLLSILVYFETDRTSLLSTLELMMTWGLFVRYN